MTLLSFILSLFGNASRITLENFEKGIITLCLHPSSDQSERVTGHLPTGAGYGSTGKQHQNAGIGRIFGVF